jgi:chemotaxis regulatin CheY-phosphate phosphatase CheZ
MSEQSLIKEEDYEAIEAAVMETARGRWFLQEYTRRNRNSDTKMVLGAIKRVEDVVDRQARANEDAERLRAELVEMGTAIAKTRKEIAALRPEGDDSGAAFSATDELECIVQQTEKATQDILSTAEQIQEIAWTLRENKVEETFCAALDGYATDIYIACSFQDLTGQRTARIVSAIQALEKRINSMVDIWYLDESEVEEDDVVFVDNSEQHLLNGPSNDGVQQDTVDILIDDHSSYDPSQASTQGISFDAPEIEKAAPQTPIDAKVESNVEADNAPTYANEDGSSGTTGRLIAVDDDELDIAFVDHHDQVNVAERAEIAAESTTDTEVAEDLEEAQPTLESHEEVELAAELAQEDHSNYDDSLFADEEPDVMTLVEAAQDAQMHVAEARNNPKPAQVEQAAQSFNIDEALENADLETMTDGQKTALFS